MYTIIKSVINSGNFELTDILTKIDTLWVQGSIKDSQRTELIALARSKATPEATYAPLQEQVDALAERLDALTARVTAIEAGTPAEPPAEPDEWPEFVQPMGAHDAYGAGDKITYNGQHYICQMDGCVWSPDAYPAAWELQEESGNEEQSVDGEESSSEQTSSTGDETDSEV